MVISIMEYDKIQRIEEIFPITKFEIIRDIFSEGVYVRVKAYLCF
mgnify:CR=1 FL=1